MQKHNPARMPRNNVSATLTTFIKLQGTLNILQYVYLLNTSSIYLPQLSTHEVIISGVRFSYFKPKVRLSEVVFHPRPPRRGETKRKAMIGLGKRWDRENCCATLRSWDGTLKIRKR